MVCLSDRLGGVNGIANIKRLMEDILKYRGIQAPTAVPLLLEQLNLPVAYVVGAHKDLEA